MVKSTAVEAGQDASREGHSHSPIDMGHLSRQALGDPGLQEEVLRLYAQTSVVYLTRIETSTTVPALLQHLHVLKSAAAGIGAWRVRDLAKVAEDELREGKPVNPERIDDLAMAVAECSDYIAGLIDQQVD